MISSLPLTDLTLILLQQAKIEIRNMLLSKNQKHVYDDTFEMFVQSGVWTSNVVLNYTQYFNFQGTPLVETLRII